MHSIVSFDTHLSVVFDAFCGSGAFVLVSRLSHGVKGADSLKGLHGFHGFKVVVV